MFVLLFWFLVCLLLLSWGAGTGGIYGSLKQFLSSWYTSPGNSSFLAGIRFLWRLFLVGVRRFLTLNSSFLVGVYVKLQQREA